MNATRTRISGLLSTLLAAAAAFPAVGRGEGLEALQARNGLSFEAAVGSAVLDAKPMKEVSSRNLFAEVEPCRIVDAKFFLALSMDESLKMLQPCMKEISRQYGVPVAAHAANFGVGDNDPKPIEGIDLRIEAAALPMNSRIIQDLQYSLSLRHQMLFGFPARVLWRKPDMRTEVESSLQQAVNRCPAPMVIRPLDTVDDFVRYYGRCLSQDPNLKIKGLRPAGSEGRDLAVWTEAADSDVARMNGSVVVHGPKGPVTFVVEAYR